MIYTSMDHAIYYVPDNCMSHIYYLYLFLYRIESESIYLE